MKQHLPFLALLVACNIDGVPQSEQVPYPVVIHGQAAEVSPVSGITPLPGLRVTAFSVDDDVTPLAEAATDALGNYSITVMVPWSSEFNGYLRASAAGLVDTFVYPPSLYQDYASAPIRLVSADTFQALGYVCSGNQLAGNGLIAALVRDENQAGVAGVTVASKPASNKYCYTGTDALPDSVQLTTTADGMGYLFNVTGPVMVTATKPGAMFQGRAVTARADVVTMTLLDAPPPPGG